MTRVFWTPKTNTQRSALARFGTDWQLVSAADPEIIRTVHGRLCWFIHPVGRPFEARWVPVEQVKLKEGVA
jgi:hypothetical protein